MRAGIGAAVAAACVLAGSASAQSAMTLESFVTRANRIPLNATAMLRPDAHRLKGEAERAFNAVGREIREARAAGRKGGQISRGGRGRLVAPADGAMPAAADSGTDSGRQD